MATPADLSNEDTQSLELATLKATLDNDFIEAPATPWKVQPKQPQFWTRIKRDGDERIQFRLHFVIYKNYPYKAPPQVTVEGPTQGINQSKLNALKKDIEAYAKQRHAEAPGSPILFDIVDYATQLLATKVPAPVDITGSLATEMIERAKQEDRRRAEELARTQAEEQARIIQENAAILQDMDAEREKRVRRRNRANSETTEVANSSFVSDHATDGFPVENFPHEMSFLGITFRSVRLYGKRRRDTIFATYDSDPICEDVNASLPIETYIVDFGTTTYYGTTAGRKELRAIEADLQRMRRITQKNQNLLRILGVKLTLPGDHRRILADEGDVTSPRLVIVAEQPPTLSLWDVLDTLEESGSWMSETKASDYLKQVLSALNALHSENVIHRCINPRCIYLSAAPSPHSKQGAHPRLTTKLVKISKTSYFTQLVDLFRANPWSTATLSDLDLPVPPSEGWLSHEVRYNDRLFAYTQNRDVHDAGVVFCQMVMGLNALTLYDSPQNALANSTHLSDLSQRVIQRMFQPPSRKEPITCLTILALFRNETIIPSNVDISRPKGGFLFNGDPRTPVAINYNHAGEMNYFAPNFLPQHQPTQHYASRWRDDFEQLAELGKGGFGSVIKARNRTDKNIYAVKKVRIRHTDPRAQERTLREVSTLSRIHHRYIVRYFNAWVEDSNEPMSGHSSDTDGSGSSSSAETSTESDVSGDTIENWRSSGRPDDSDLSWPRMMAKMEADAKEPEPIESNFPSINFGGGTDGGNSSSDEDDDELVSAPTTPPSTATPFAPQSWFAAERTFSILYIQMEFVENQTLKELVEVGMQPDEAWKLFGQLVEALVYLADAKIIHRDIKLTNIFIDGNRNCKIGDFVTLDPSLLDGRSLVPQQDMTQNIGTRIYIAPEILARPSTKGPKRYHHKADLYSLGIVFFEMNYPFSTESERYVVIERLRSPQIIFPHDWNTQLANQREIINLLLQHNPDNRPTAHELQNHRLIPPRIGDEYFREALHMLAQPDSNHYTALLDTLFSQPQHRHLQLVYNEAYEPPSYLTIVSFVQDHLNTIFRLHGAVWTEIPLLMMDRRDKAASFIDRRGTLVSLPHNMLINFARTAVLRSHRWIKRYFIGNTYEDNPVDGHPTPTQTAVFDIVSVNASIDAPSSGAELLTIVNSIFEAFPKTLLGEYCIYMSHTKIIQHALSKIPKEQQSKVLDLFHGKGPTRMVDTIRPALLNLNLPRSLVDELEILGSSYEHQDEFLLKLEKVTPGISNVYAAAIPEVQMTIATARSAGVVRRYSKRGQAVVLANGGRYDKNIKDWAPATFNSEHIMAFGMTIFVDKLLGIAVQYQSSLTTSIKKEARTFGYWIPRRCDVYIVSWQQGHLEDRWKLVASLWQNNISADLCYESAIPLAPSLEGTCEREGILFLVYTPRHSKNEVKVRSILSRTEHEIPVTELVPWLQQQLKDQKTLDWELASDATSPVLDPALAPAPLPLPIKAKETSFAQLQVVLPTPAKNNKGKGASKDRPLGQAKTASDRVLKAMNSGMPTLAIDVPVSLFDLMVRDSQWITNDDLWKSMTSQTITPSHAFQIREAVVFRKNEGHDYLLLFCGRGPGDEGRIQLLRLN
ncbi:other/PEK/GCN2 protein kinase [Flagelloscypha sp. PMI_526]|nr:other/PEK/GCN2 protein kinase [Flagelloscypha sp. PMI_526]